MMVVPSPAAALDLLSLARAQMGDGVSAFELIHRQGLDFLRETLPDLRQPFADAPEWSVLIEVGLAQGLDPARALETLFEARHEAGLVPDGVIAQSEAQRQAFWAVREHIPEANRRIGAVFSHDISLPLGAIPDFIAEARAGLRRSAPSGSTVSAMWATATCITTSFRCPDKSTRRPREPARRDQTAIHDLVQEMDGSFSAEHGIGRLKVDDLERYGDPVKLATMRAIKATLDPVGIMNPGAVLRAP